MSTADTLPVLPDQFPSAHSAESAPAHHGAPECTTFSNCDPPQPAQIPQLSQRQLAAIDLLAQGRSDSDIAAELHADRHTIHRWRTRSAAFQAELNARRQALWDNLADRFTAVVTKALKVVEGDLKSGLKDSRAAAIILRVAGIKRLAPSIGPTTEDEILRQHILRARSTPQTPITPEQIQDARRQLSAPDLDQTPSPNPASPTGT